MGKLSLKNKNHKLVPTATIIYQYFFVPEAYCLFARNVKQFLDSLFRT